MSWSGFGEFSVWKLFDDDWYESGGRDVSAQEVWGAY
jgi:hypothetical protein